MSLSQGGGGGDYYFNMDMNREAIIVVSAVLPENIDPGILQDKIPIIIQANTPNQESINIYS